MSKQEIQQYEAVFTHFTRFYYSRRPDRGATMILQQIQAQMLAQVLSPMKYYHVVDLREVLPPAYSAIVPRKTAVKAFHILKTVCQV